MTDADESATRAVAYKLCAEMMRALGRALAYQEILALSDAAAIIAREPSEAAREELTRYTVDRALTLVGHAA